jgi:hypothetical protein
VITGEDQETGEGGGADRVELAGADEVFESGGRAV